MFSAGGGGGGVGVARVALNDVLLLLELSNELDLNTFVQSLLVGWFENDVFEEEDKDNMCLMQHSIVSAPKRQERVSFADNHSAT